MHISWNHCCVINHLPRPLELLFMGLIKIHRCCSLPELKFHDRVFHRHKILLPPALPQHLHNFKLSYKKL